MRYSIAIFSMALAFGLAGCERSSEKPSGESKPPAAATRSNDGHDHKPGDSHEDEGAHGGEVVALGTTQISEFTVRVSRDKGEIKPGGDAPIDVWVTTSDGQPAKIAAVRFWIGTEDAKGSMKAKAEIEDPKEANRWHTHAEVPDPLPNSGKLWVEIEDLTGKKTTGSFDLGS